MRQQLREALVRRGVVAFYIQEHPREVTHWMGRGIPTGRAMNQRMQKRFFESSAPLSGLLVNQT